MIPNHLEASFKRNKCESSDEDASSALEKKMAALTSQGSTSHSNLALTQTLPQILIKVSSRRDWDEVFEAQECVLHKKVSSPSKRGYLNPSSQN